MPISRKDEGILGNLTAQKNITISMLDKVGFLINRKKEHDITLHMMEDFNVQPKNTEQNITSFSGGNQQKIVLSRWIAANKNWYCSTNLPVALTWVQSRKYMII